MEKVEKDFTADGERENVGVQEVAKKIALISGWSV